MKLALTNPQGDKVDTEDAEVKRAILDTKMMMAKEHRAALREVLLMGVTRLVVEKGSIEAAVEFMITANRKSTACTTDQNINTASIEQSLRLAAGRPVRRSQRVDEHDQHQHPGQHLAEGGHRHLSAKLTEK